MALLLQIVTLTDVGQSARYLRAIFMKYLWRWDKTKSPRESRIPPMGSKVGDGYDS